MCLFMSSHVQPWGTTVVNVGPAWSSFPARPGEAREHTDSETNRNRAHGSGAALDLGTAHSMLVRNVRTRTRNRVVARVDWPAQLA